MTSFGATRIVNDNGFQIPSNDYQVVISVDRTPVGEHERRFNAPSVEEVAIRV